MSDGSETWTGQNIYKVREQREPKVVVDIDVEKLRKEVEPWLTALFQSEHLSLLMGAGISSAIHKLATGTPGVGMPQIPFTTYSGQIDKACKISANKSGRGAANIEDQIRVANELINGLEVYTSIPVYGSKKIIKELKKLKHELHQGLTSFVESILVCERNIIKARNEVASECLMNFLISFASRSATRERLNLYTLNYDRVIEYGAELAGIRLIDRFVGTINPVFRSSRMEVDLHYNPPGIRGEPRYLEGVVQFTKLHGSLDWIMRDDVVRRIALPYGAEDIGKYTSADDTLMIYPNATKDRETSEYPYVELFRDFAVSVCRPNSTLVLYGYSFGDQHINRVIEDMLTIPSTHLVIISWSDIGNRISRFYKRLKRPAQISLLIGEHFGDLEVLVNNYLPKPAIDRTTVRMADLLKARGLTISDNNKEEMVEA